MTALKELLQQEMEVARTDADIIVLNAAVLGFVDELLRLPAPAAMIAAVELLYGRDTVLPDELTALVGKSSQPFGPLITSSRPLATLTPSRFGPAAAWRDGASGLKAARALARDRYRQLQTAFLSGAPRVAPEANEALVRYTYGAQGRQWLWTEAAQRLLDRVVALNRAALSLMASVARGERTLGQLSIDGALPPRNFDLPSSVLDILAEALPPVAIPDWGRVAVALQHTERALAAEEATARYRSLFAEMLGLAVCAETPA